MLQINTQEWVIFDWSDLFKGVLEVLLDFWHIANIEVEGKPVIKFRVLLIGCVQLQKGSGNAAPQVHMRCDNEVDLKSNEDDQGHVYCRSQRKAVIYGKTLKKAFVITLAFDFRIPDSFRRVLTLIELNYRHQFLFNLVIIQYLFYSPNNQ